MDVEDFLEPEIAVAAAVTAAVTSPQVRKALRTGAVYGLAGLLTAGDALATFSKSVGRGVQQASSEAAGGVQQAASNGHPSHHATTHSATHSTTHTRAKEAATTDGEGGHE
jgi:hypothetical protein